MYFGPYPAVITSIHDGDTCRMRIDLGFGIFAEQFACRFYGINAPELSTDEGKRSRDHLEEIMPVGSKVLVISHSWDKYGGRFDGEITLNGVSINHAMVDDGYAVEMDY